MSTGGRGEFHANDELMRLMGSKKGSDPIPPDQYLYFLEDPDPEQRVPAYVRSKTIRMGHRSPFCVDEHARPITLDRLAADCGWQPSHASEYLSRLETKGLVRTERGGTEPGTEKDLRIYLCGRVPLRSQVKAKEKRTPIPCTEEATRLAKGG